MDITAIIIAASIPSAITGFCFWLVERKIQKRDAERKEEQQRMRDEADKKERQRERYELYLLKSVDATTDLCVATAKAVQRIPDAHCNGDMQGALDYAQKVKHEKKDFLTQTAIEALEE